MTPTSSRPEQLHPNDAVVAHEVEMDTAWGRLTRLGPVLRMSETPPRWTLPPAPLGSDPATWA